MRKKLPKLKSDAAAEAFVARADLTLYDLSGMTSVRFEEADGSRDPLLITSPLIGNADQK
jgi:hypothetical protein